jgi:hypothetical protein
MPSATAPPTGDLAGHSPKISLPRVLVGVFAQCITNDLCATALATVTQRIRFSVAQNRRSVAARALEHYRGTHRPWPAPLDIDGDRVMAWGR